MEDFILREIDRLGQMLLLIARRLGLFDSSTHDYTLADVKDEFEKVNFPLDLDEILQMDNPIWYLVENEKLGNHGLETFIDILYHSDMDEAKKDALLEDAVAYLNGKGFFSFKLHSLRMN